MIKRGRIRRLLLKLPRAVSNAIQNARADTWTPSKEHSDQVKKTLGGCFRRTDGNPIVKPNMPGLEGKRGRNINGPSLIKVPEWIDNPLGKYYLYFGHHNGSYIRLAYSDSITGPYSVYSEGTLRIEQTAIAGHISSPDVHINHEKKEIWMYFHGSVAGTGVFADQTQTSFLARSKDGINFTSEIEQSPERHILAPFYLRVFEHERYYYGIAKNRNHSGMLVRSKDGISQFERGPEILNGMRHCALVKPAGQPDRLWLFYSCVNSKPERIVFSEMLLGDDWKNWKPSEPTTILFPETDWEGSKLRSKLSQAGSTGPTKALRDPAVYVENDQVFLLYSVKGEQGIGIAELIRNQVGTQLQEKCASYA